MAADIRLTDHIRRWRLRRHLRQVEAGPPAGWASWCRRGGGMSLRPTHRCGRDRSLTRMSPSLPSTRCDPVACAPRLGSPDLRYRPGGRVEVHAERRSPGALHTSSEAVLRDPRVIKPMEQPTSPGGSVQSRGGEAMAPDHWWAGLDARASSPMAARVDARVSAPGASTGGHAAVCVDPPAGASPGLVGSMVPVIPAGAVAPEAIAAAADALMLLPRAAGMCAARLAPQGERRRGDCRAHACVTREAPTSVVASAPLLGRDGPRSAGPGAGGRVRKIKRRAQGVKRPPTGGLFYWLGFQAFSREDLRSGR
jgi:hypothetical protein